MWPSPYGLFLGYLFVVLGQAAVLLYYVVRRIFLRSRNFVQVKQVPSTLASDLLAHVSAPESFFLVFGYLAVVWMFELLPPSYYDLSGRISVLQLLLQFLVTDFFTYAMHRLEHAWPALYQRSHKAHHKWTSPRLYNAFNGSVPDTISLILIPLFLTHQVCRSVNNWTFIAFGTLYAAQFTLIHCEYVHPWDWLFEMVGIGTAEDHSVHHALVTYNYGHFFTYFDRLFGTYKSGKTCNKMRSYELAHTKQEP